MFARLTLPRNLIARLCALFAVLWLAACEGGPMLSMGGNGPSVDTSRPVKVALLVPGGSASQGDVILASNLTNAARMAAADLAPIQIDLQVYNTAGSAAQASAVAQQAAQEGAAIILGPLHREAAVAASTAVARDGINVLSFSNTSTIAGGNLFLLGQLYESTSRRLLGYATSQGVTRFYVVSAEGPAGDLGRAAIANAAAAVGGQIVGSKSYALSQADIMAATDSIIAEARASGAQAIVTTAQPGAELAILGTMLPEKGLRTQMIGLTRWNSAPEMLQVPGLEGGLFAMPNTARQAAFQSRYAAAYGSTPHPLAGLAYDGVAAIGALIATGSSDALSSASLTRRSGFQGTSGIFRLLRNGMNERGMAVATVTNGQIQVLQPAPASFGNAIN